MAQNAPAAKRSLIPEEEEARSAAPERSASLHEMLHPLPVRRHGEDPKVRYAEVRPVDSLAPCLLIAEELSEKAGLRESLPPDRHCAPVGFEEEKRMPSVLRPTLVAKPEDLIRFHAQVVRLPIMADIDLPAEGEAQAPGRLRCPREHLFRPDELHPLAAPAGDLKGHHDLGDCDRVVQEDPGEVPVLRVPPDASRPRHTLGLEDLRATVPEGIDQGFGALGIPVELHGWAIEVAVVEEELEAAEGRLLAPAQEGDEVGGAKKPMAVDGAEDSEIAGREDHRAHRRALEARPANLWVRHWDSSVPAGRWTARRRYEPPSQR